MFAGLPTASVAVRLWGGGLGVHRHGVERAFPLTRADSVHGVDRLYRARREASAQQWTHRHAGTTRRGPGRFDASGPR